MTRRQPISTRTDTLLPNTTLIRSTGTREGGSGSGSAQNPCTYSVLDTRMSDIADDMAVDEIGPPRGEEPGRWYRRICDLGNGDTSGSIRSEEHTSELQSLMRNSSADFCLNQKINNK